MYQLGAAWTIVDCSSKNLTFEFLKSLAFDIRPPSLDIVSSAFTYLSNIFLESEVLHTHICLKHFAGAILVPWTLNIFSLNFSFIHKENLFSPLRTKSNFCFFIDLTIFFIYLLMTWFPTLIRVFSPQAIIIRPKSSAKPTILNPSKV